MSDSPGEGGGVTTGFYGIFPSAVPPLTSAPHVLAIGSDNLCVEKGEASGDSPAHSAHFLHRHRFPAQIIEKRTVGMVLRDQPQLRDHSRV